MIEKDNEVLKLLNKMMFLQENNVYFDMLPFDLFTFS